MANYDRPRMTFIRANAVKRKMKVPTEDGDVIAGPGDYIVIFPNQKHTVLDHHDAATRRPDQ